LEAAASFGHIEIVELLIKAGADYQEALEAAQERGDEGENAVDTLLDVSPTLLKA
jgi:ankyrin repeat protein